MKMISIINKDVNASNISDKKEITIAGKNVLCATIETQFPKIDMSIEKNKDFVLIKIKAFSCNYRDKNLIINNSENTEINMQELSSPFTFFGSDFVAKIVDKGKDVKELSVGDRVIPNCSYPVSVIPGVVTNDASKGWLLVHKDKLLKIPNTMNDDIAASFSVGAQTSYSMIRRANIEKKDTILVYSGRSNTSLSIIKTLLNMGINNIIVLSTKKWNDDEKEFISGSELIYTEDYNDWVNQNENRFDVVFDPFYDLHIEDAVKCLNYYGRYITCGFKNQNERFVENSDKEIQVHRLLTQIMIKNISLIGNCIGSTEDLQKQIDGFDPEDPILPIYSVYNCEKSDDFLYDTYENKNRFGKVVMKLN